MINRYLLIIVFISFLFACGSSRTSAKKAAEKAELNSIDSEEVIMLLCSNMGFIEPEFPGGDHALRQLLRENIRYPQRAIQMEVEEEIIVEFVIERDGTIVEVEVVQGTNPDLMNEAMRVVSIMPRWYPGFEKRQPIRVKYALPIIFKFEYSLLQVYGKEQKLRFPKYDFGLLNRIFP
jgi:TonB family protein